MDSVITKYNTYLQSIENFVSFANSFLNLVDHLQCTDTNPRHFLSQVAALVSLMDFQSSYKILVTSRNNSRSFKMLDMISWEGCLLQNTKEVSDKTLQGFLK